MIQLVGCRHRDAEIRDISRCFCCFRCSLRVGRFGVGSSAGAGAGAWTPSLRWVRLPHYALGPLEVGFAFLGESTLSLLGI